MDLDEPMGSDTLVWLTMGGQQIRGRGPPPTTACAAASRSGSGFDISKASLFDQESEQRL